MTVTECNGSTHDGHRPSPHRRAPAVTGGAAGDPCTRPRRAGGVAWGRRQPSPRAHMLRAVKGVAQRQTSHQDLERCRRENLAHPFAQFGRTTPEKRDEDAWRSLDSSNPRCWTTRPSTASCARTARRSSAMRAASAPRRGRGRRGDRSDGAAPRLPGTRRAARRDQEWRAWLSTVAPEPVDRRAPASPAAARDRRRRPRVRFRRPGESGRPGRRDAPRQARQICAAIALLPPAQRAAIYLREVRGHSYEEIADELGESRCTAVTATLHRARAGVRRHAAAGSRTRSPAVALSPIGLLRRGAASVDPPGDRVGHRRAPRPSGRARRGRGRRGDRRCARHARRYAAGGHSAGDDDARGNGTSAATRSRRLAIPRPSPARPLARRAVVAMGCLARVSRTPLPQASRSTATTTVTVRAPGASRPAPAGAPDATPAEPDKPAKPPSPQSPTSRRSRKSPASPGSPTSPRSSTRRRTGKGGEAGQAREPDKPARHVEGRGSPTSPAAASNHRSEVPASAPPGAALGTHGRASNSASASSAARSAEAAPRSACERPCGRPARRRARSNRRRIFRSPGPAHESSGAPVAGEPQVPAHAPGNGPS